MGLRARFADLNVMAAARLSVLRLPSSARFVLRRPFRQTAVHTVSRKDVGSERLTPRAGIPSAEKVLAAARANEVAFEISRDGESGNPADRDEERYGD